MDKSVPKNPKPKGAEYCNKKGTSCYYNHLNICVNCGRQKGWRIMQDREWKADGPAPEGHDGVYLKKEQ